MYILFDQNWNETTLFVYLVQLLKFLYHKNVSLTCVQIKQRMNLMLNNISYKDR